MKIILMRHGQAEGYRQPDNDRQLTDFGRKQAKETASYLMDKYAPDMFVVSTYDRAQQTLEAFTSIAPATPVKILDSITPDCNASNALNELYKLADNDADNNKVKCMLVVCHMPIVANMAGQLTNQWATSYQLAEARVIECEAIAENLGTQVDAFIPQQV